MIEMPQSISKDTAKLLKDITGEPRLDAAIRMTVKDALKHRLEMIESDIRDLKDKYGMKFTEFEEAWENGKIEEKYSYDVESDYWEWEELVTRKKKIEKALSEIE